MSESGEPREPARTPVPPPEYQPPAIAWEEPLEAIAAATCALIPLECAGAAIAD
jgi:hypothetical protein